MFDPAPDWTPDPQTWAAQHEEQGVPWPSHTGRNAMIGIACVVAVVVALAIGFAVSSDSTNAGPQTMSNFPGLLGSTPESEERRIRTALSVIEDSWNSSDYTAFMSHACSEIRGKRSNSESNFTRQRTESGTIKFAIDSITVDGAFARVEVTERFSNQDTVTEQLDFRKEEDEWRLC
jgi:hypothetical protein